MLSGEPKETLNRVRYRTDQVTFCVYRYNWTMGSIIPYSGTDYQVMAK